MFTLALSIQPTRAGQFFSSKERAAGDALYKSAFTAYQTGDYPHAQELLGQAEKLKPDQADGWNLRGAVYLKQRHYDQAEAAFKRAIALDPKLWAAQFNYAEAAFRGKNYPLARSRFDRLVDQTNRYKEKNQWELAQYKAFLSSLLMNDDLGAQKRMAKLPVVGGVTPALAYAQAAVAFRRRDDASAQKSLSLAQTTYSSSLNSLFADSLESAGWQSSVVPPGMVLAASNGPTPTSIGPAGPSRPAYVVDPRLEAAAAEPLPAPESPVTPSPANRRNVPAVELSPSDALLHPSSAVVSPAALPTPAQDSALERGTLLD